MIELQKRTYNLVFIACEVVFALLLSFTVSIPYPSPKYFPLQFGLFSIVRSAATMLTVPHHADVFGYESKLIWTVKLKRLDSQFGFVHVMNHPMSFYWARYLSTAPVRVLGSVLLSAILYPVTGLRRGFDHFMIFLLVLLLQTMTGVALSMMVSAVCARREGLARYIAVMLLKFNVVFSGTLIPLPRMNKYLRWMHFLAYGYYATIAYNQNEYNGISFANESGIDFLEQRGLVDMTLWGSIGILSAFLIIYNLIGMLALAWHWNRELREQSKHAGFPENLSVYQRTGVA